MKHMNFRWILVIILMIFAIVAIFIYYRQTHLEYSKTVFLLDTIIDIKASGNNSQEAIEQALLEMKRLQGMFDRYDEDSEISQINNNAGIIAVEVSSESWDVLQQAKQINQLTNGAFDVTIGPLTDLWSVGRNNHLPTEQEIKQCQELIGNEKLQLNDRKVFLIKQGMSLDLGGIGKVYALDKAIEILKSYGIQSALINAGGDIRVIGRRSDGKSWRVGLQDPVNSEKVLAAITLDNWDTTETSGDYQRYFDQDGIRYSHIFDPHSGHQPRQFHSVTMLSHGAVGPLVSSALFIMPLATGQELAKKLNIGVIWVLADGQIVITNNLKGTVEILDTNNQ